MENLIDVLNKENSEYEELLKLSRRKTPIIVSGDLEQLQQVTDEEQIVVGRINQLEKSRTEVVTDIANVLNKDVDTLKLTNIIAMLAARPAEQKVLAEVHDKLHETVYALKSVNDHNRELLTNSLEMVAFEMNLLQAMKAAPETANYNKGAYNAGATMGVVSGCFDAKQ